jgi:hypothetical protein
MAPILAITRAPDNATDNVIGNTRSEAIDGPKTRGTTPHRGSGFRASPLSLPERGKLPAEGL